MFRRSFTYSSKKARCVPWERAPLWRDLPSCWIHICVTWRLVGLTLNKIFLCKLHPFLVLCLLCFRLSMQCPVLCRCHAIGTEMSAFRCFLSPYRTFSHMHSISPPSPTPSFTEQGVLSPSIFRLILKKTYSQMTVCLNVLQVLLNLLYTCIENWWDLVSTDEPPGLWWLSICSCFCSPSNVKECGLSGFSSPAL